MKEKLTRNIGLKILSVILAAILWLVITNVDDPIETRTLRDIEVDIINEDVINSLDQTYKIIEGDKIDFTYAARRSVADSLSKSDFKVTADFAKLSRVYAVAIEITCPRYGDEVVITNMSNPTMVVELEDLEQKNFMVSINIVGKTAEGYVVGEKTARPNIIQVEGPKSKIERIAKIAVDIEVYEERESYQTMGLPKALDEEGEVIDTSNLKFSYNNIDVIYVDANIDIYKTKEVDLLITPTGEPASGYAMTSIEYEPKKIEIAGEKEKLRNIHSITITEDITGQRENIEKEINISEQLPEGIILVGEDQTAVVNITIERNETKEITIWPGDIEQRNKPQDLTVSYITTGPITVRVTGPSEDIEDVSRLSLKPYIDLEHHAVGTYSLNIQSDIPDNVTILNNPMLSIKLTQ